MKACHEPEKCRPLQLQNSEQICVFHLMGVLAKLVFVNIPRHFLFAIPSDYSNTLQDCNPLSLHRLPVEVAADLQGSCRGHSDGNWKYPETRCRRGFWLCRLGCASFSNLGRTATMGAIASRIACTVTAWTNAAPKTLFFVRHVVDCSTFHFPWFSCLTRFLKGTLVHCKTTNSQFVCRSRDP